MEEPSRVEPEASPGVCVEAVGGDAAESGPAAGRSDTASVPRVTQHAENWWETLRSLLVVLVLVFGIRTFIAEAPVIPSGSREKNPPKAPTSPSTRRLKVRRASSWIRRLARLARLMLTPAS